MFENVCESVCLCVRESVCECARESVSVTDLVKSLLDRVVLGTILVNPIP